MPFASPWIVAHCAPRDRPAGTGNANGSGAVALRLSQKERKNCEDQEPLARKAYKPPVARTTEPETHGGADTHYGAEHALGQGKQHSADWKGGEPDEQQRLTSP